MIVVPYTELYEPTREAVPDAEFVRVDDRDGYRLLLAKLWEAGDAFTLVEHDVVPTRNQLDSLDACPESWCYHGYYPGHWIPVFGCVRFSRELIAGTRGVWDDASWPWSQLDMRFATAARAAGWRHHWHSPHVRHGGNYFHDADGVREDELDDELTAYLIEREREAIERTRCLSQRT